MIYEVLVIFMQQAFNLWIPIFFVLIFAIAAHESGHYFYLKVILKREVEITEGLMSISFDKEGLNKVDLFNVYSFGIGFGFFPLIVLPYPQFLIAFALYLYGCKHDFKKIWRLINGNNNT